MPVSRILDTRESVEGWSGSRRILASMGRWGSEVARAVRICRRVVGNQKKSDFQTALSKKKTPREERKSQTYSTQLIRHLQQLCSHPPTQTKWFRAPTIKPYARHIVLHDPRGLNCQFRIRTPQLKDQATLFEGVTLEYGARVLEVGDRPCFSWGDVRRVRDLSRARGREGGRRGRRTTHDSRGANDGFVDDFGSPDEACAVLKCWE